MLSVQPSILPYLGVYIIEEVLSPDGDANAGNVRFLHNLRIGFTAMVANNDQVEAEKAIDAAYWRIMNVLWTDPYLLNVIDTYNHDLQMENPDNTRIEGVTRATRRHVFGTPQQNNETPVAEVQFDVNIAYRTTWIPVIKDDLLEINVRTGIKIGETEEEMAQRQQVGADYTFETEEQRNARSQNDDAGQQGISRGEAATREDGDNQSRSPDWWHPRDPQFRRTAKGTQAPQRYGFPPRRGR
jgi:hypothetical protein